MLLLGEGASLCTDAVFNDSKFCISLQIRVLNAFRSGLEHGSIIIVGDAGEVCHEEILESQNMTKSPHLTNIKHDSKGNQDHLDIQQPFRPATEEVEEDEEGEIDGDPSRARVLWVKSLSRLRAQVNSIMIVTVAIWGGGLLVH